MKTYLFTIEDNGINFIISTDKKIENCIDEVTKVINKQYSHEVEVTYDECRGFYINGYSYVRYTSIETYMI